MIRDLMRHIDIPGVPCFCPICIDKRAADRQAVAEMKANIAAIEEMRGEIRANTDPEELK